MNDDERLDMLCTLRELVAHSFKGDLNDEEYRDHLKSWSRAMKEVAIECGVASEDPGLFVSPSF